MRTRSLLLAVAVAMLPIVSNAAVSELSQTELRALVTNGHVISAQAVVHGVKTNFGGRVLEIRAFATTNGIAYRVLLQQANGDMGEVMVDGLNGHQIMQGSSLGNEISTTARTSIQTAAAATTRPSSSQGNATGNDRSRAVRNDNASSQSSNGNSAGNRNSNGNSNGNGNAKGRNK